MSLFEGLDHWSSYTRTEASFKALQRFILNCLNVILLKTLTLNLFAFLLRAFLRGFEYLVLHMKPYANSLLKGTFLSSIEVTKLHLKR